MALGQEAAGPLVEFGSDVMNLSVGDRVRMEPGVPDLPSRASKHGFCATSSLRIRQPDGAPVSGARLKELDAIVDRRPDVATDGVVGWRGVDLQRIVADKYENAMSERPIGRILQPRRFRHVSARLRHPRSDPAAQDLFKRPLAIA